MSDDEPGPVPGADVHAKSVKYAQGEVFIFRKKGSFSAWIVSTDAVRTDRWR